jgi:hypothetical protein
MKTHRSGLRQPKGFVTIYMVFSLLTLVPLVGMAIDFSVLYNVKGKLQAAVDAAAIGAGVTLQRSTTINDPAIPDTCQRFFNANYAAGSWGTTQAYYNATPSEDVNRVRSIVVNAGEYVPMLFLRVLGIKNSTVAATATVKIRYVTMMIVVDRSGSVVRAGNDTAIKNALTTFVASSTTSYLVDGRDEVGVVSFGGTTRLDFAPTLNFRSGNPNIGGAISGIPFANNATNTADGLQMAYAQLKALNQTSSLNVIVLLTDGRPSAFSATLDFSHSLTCLNKSSKTGFLTATVGNSWPPLPPQIQGGMQDTQIWNLGFFNTTYQGIAGYSGSDMYYVPNSTGCSYSLDPTTLGNDVATFPATDQWGNSLTGPVYQGEGQSITDPRAIRYAAFNAADNMATTIRTDTTIRPILFVIGLNEPASGGEPLDADWLARVANDPGWKDVNGNSVFQRTQTSGKYYNVNSSQLGAAFQEIASQILRLAM